MEGRGNKKLYSYISICLLTQIFKKSSNYYIPWMSRNRLTKVLFVKFFPGREHCMMSYISNQRVLVWCFLLVRQFSHVPQARFRFILTLESTSQISRNGGPKNLSGLPLAPQLLLAEPESILSSLTLKLLDFTKLPFFYMSPKLSEVITKNQSYCLRNLLLLLCLRTPINFHRPHSVSLSSMEFQ